MEDKLENMVEVNACEGSWLPDLMNEFMYEYPDNNFDESIKVLSDAIVELCSRDIIGIDEYIPNTDICRDVNFDELAEILGDQKNWKYGRFDEKKIALWHKKAKPIHNLTYGLLKDLWNFRNSEP